MNLLFLWSWPKKKKKLKSLLLKSGEKSNYGWSHT